MRRPNALASALVLTLALAGAAAAAGPSTPPTPTGAARANMGQIPAPASSAIDVQQTPPAAPASAVSADQLSPVMHAADAPAGPAKVADGSDARVAAVKGRDHCDAAAPGANKAECAQILDTQADAFSSSAPLQPAPVDAAKTDASGLVDSIVNGGTGSVVNLPPQQGQPQPQA